MGSRRRRAIMFQDEELIERRRSSRIIALEEKREKERESKELERKNDSDNHDNNRNNGKRKKTTDVGNHFIYDINSDEDEQYSPTKKKGRKCKALHQLISSTQPMQEGQHPENGSTSRKNVSTPNVMPEKHVLEFVLNLLQRNDPEELFAEPVNPNVEDYYSIVKQPMDFTTMRAKLHEGMYTSMEYFKRDVYLMCTNAMSANPANTRPHQVAKAISTIARKAFKDLSAPDPEHFKLDSSLNKRPLAAPSRKPHGGQCRTTRHARFCHKPAGNMATEMEKRYKYWLPNNKSLFSRVLNAQPIIQLNKNAGNYEDSLLRFVEELGPTAQTVAAKKLNILKFKQLLNGETPTPNLLANVSSTQPTPQLGPTQPDALNNVHELLLALSLSNNPLTIPGVGASENRNVNTISGGSVNSIEGAYNNGKKLSVKYGWHARAAALLSNFFLNYDKKETNNGVKDEEPNLTIDIWGPSKDKMVSSNENVSSPQGHVQQGGNQNLELQLGVGQWNKHVSSTSKDVSTSSSHVPHVWPTYVISGTSLLPHRMLARSMSSNNPSGQSVLPSQAASFSRWNEPDKSLYALGRTPSHFNNGPYQAQATHEQLGQVNPMGPFPLREQKSSSALQMSLGSEMNYSVGRLQDQPREATSLILLDDDQESNLTLQL